MATRGSDACSLARTRREESCRQDCQGRTVLDTGELCLFLPPLAGSVPSQPPGSPLSPPGDKTTRLNTAEAGLELSLDSSVCRKERRSERVEEEWGGLRQRGWIEGRREE